MGDFGVLGNDINRLRELGDVEQNNKIILEEEETESTLTSAADEKESMWALCFNFINACLTNQGPMGVEQIHFMLSSLIREDFRATQSELRSFLEQKVKDEQLEKEDNLFRSKD